MKIVHLSDLHLGKRLNEFSLIEDQKDILEKIIKIIDDEKPFGVIISGDIYINPKSGCRKSFSDCFLEIFYRSRLPENLVSQYMQR